MTIGLLVWLFVLNFGAALFSFAGYIYVAVNRKRTPSGFNLFMGFLNLWFAVIHLVRIWLILSGQG